MLARRCQCSVINKNKQKISNCRRWRSLRSNFVWMSFLTGCIHDVYGNKVSTNSYNCTFEQHYNVLPYIALNDFCLSLSKKKRIRIVRQLIKCLNIWFSILTYNLCLKFMLITYNATVLKLFYQTVHSNNFFFKYWFSCSIGCLVTNRALS